MNAQSIKNKIFKQSEISLDDVIVEKTNKAYLVMLTNQLGLNEKLQMTGDQVNSHRKMQQMQIDELLSLFPNSREGNQAIFIDL